MGSRVCCSFSDKQTSIEEPMRINKTTCCSLASATVYAGCKLSQEGADL